MIINHDSSPKLEEARAKAILAVSNAAEAERQKYVTAGPGKAMEYDAKNAEALAWLTWNADPLKATKPEPSTPFISEEAAMIGKTKQEVIAEVRDKAIFWQDIGKKIGAAERKAKLALAAAGSHAAIESASDVTWPTP